MKFPLRTTSAVLALTAASPALAALTLVPGGVCSTTTTTQPALACAGAYSGNLNNTSRQTDLNAALDALAGGTYSPDVVFADVDATKNLFTLVGQDTLTFPTLFGQQIFSLHFGDAGTKLGDRTILYLFDFGPQGASSITLGMKGFSNAVLITPVPEPATWALMLLGFGAIGLVVRRRKKLLPQVA